MSSGRAYPADLRICRRAATRYPLTWAVTPASRHHQLTPRRGHVPWNGYLRGATATGSNDHMAEHCRDELCHRLPCRMYKAGKRDGYDEGYNRGFLDGEAAGFSAGFAAGAASAGGG